MDEINKRNVAKIHYQLACKQPLCDVVMLIDSYVAERACSHAIIQVSISSKTIPPGHDLKGAKPSPWDNHCVQKPFPQDRTRSQKPYPRDINLENFTNISIYCDTI